MIPDATLLQGTLAVVRNAAHEVMSRYRSQQTIWDKDDAGAESGGHAGNPVTEADLAADRVLREGLLDLLPEAGWLSEETADEPSRLERDLVWIVDPIDGTREYVEGIDQFAISVALSHRGSPVLGVLLNPATDELLCAVAGGGVTLNGAPVSAMPSRPLDGATLLASRTESRKGEFDPFKERMVVQDMGSTAWKLGLVAAGKGHAYFTRKPRNEWDIAAGVMLCREAGAEVTDLDGNAHVFNRPDPLLRGVVTAVPGVHAEVMAMIREVGTLL
ncbi:MAG: 3'(2'),5'-bisphosphate nucleotidase CysQ [Deltaproteobacteria bacterium]|nr:3'(2'),5'-bisphosphate nucleotidase CysQ [Deltaproteobacteria bacterium]